MCKPLVMYLTEFECELLITGEALHSFLSLFHKWESLDFSPGGTGAQVGRFFIMQYLVSTLAFAADSYCYKVQ